MENELNKPLTNLPEHFVKGLSQSVQVDTTGASSPLEKIMEDKKLEMPKLPPKVPEAIIVDGYTLYPDAMVMIMYSLIKLAKKDKHLDKVLRQFSLTLKDAKGTQIYPFKDKKKSKNGNS